MSSTSRLESPRVGNDVVDLSDPWTATAHQRPRFVARVCDADERARVAASDDPLALLWSLFAAKEAAFKAVSKRRPGVMFAHRRFAVAADLRSIRYQDLTLCLRVDREGDWIHAVARLGGARPVVDAVAEIDDGADQSQAVRALLYERLADELDCAPDALMVERSPMPGSSTGYGPPRLLRDGAPSSQDISLSHDGRFVAFAAMENEEVCTRSPRE